MSTDLRRYSSELSLVPGARVQLAVTGSFFLFHFFSFCTFVLTSRFRLLLYLWCQVLNSLLSLLIARRMFSAHLALDRSHLLLLLQPAPLLSCIVTSWSSDDVDLQVESCLCIKICVLIPVLFSQAEKFGRSSDRLWSLHLLALVDEVLVSASPEDG